MITFVLFPTVTQQYIRYVLWLNYRFVHRELTLWCIQIILEICKTNTIFNSLGCLLVGFFFLNDAPLRTTSHIFFVRSYTCIGYTSTSELQTMHSLWHTADINDDPSCKPHKFVCMVKIQLIYRPLPKITEPQNIFFLKNQNRTTIP